MTVATQAEMRAHYVTLQEYDLAVVERDQAVLEVRRCHADIAARDTAITNLCAKFRDRHRTPAQVAELQQQLAATDAALEMLLGLYRTTARLGGEQAGLVELVDVLDGMDQRALVGFLTAAVARLGEAS